MGDPNQNPGTPSWLAFVCLSACDRGASGAAFSFWRLSHQQAPPLTPALPAAERVGEASSRYEFISGVLPLERRATVPGGLHEHTTPASVYARKEKEGVKKSKSGHIHPMFMVHRLPLGLPSRCLRYNLQLTAACLI